MLNNTRLPQNAMRRIALRASLLAGVSVTALVHGSLAQTDQSQPNAGLGVSVPLGESTERVAETSSGVLGTGGFSISIDDKVVAGAPPPRIPQRQADQALAAADVDVRFDGLETRRLLNVSTSDLRTSFRAGETVSFRTSMNYPAYVARTEVRILDRSQRGRGVVAVLPTAPNGSVNWVMPADGPAELAYVVRTFDAKGRYDETMPLALSRTEKAFDTHETTGAPFVAAAGEGESRLRIRNIPVNGGTITASGSGGRPGGTATVMGEPVPLDASGNFVVSRIVPAGDQVVTVGINGQQIRRDVNIPENEWFYVGLADATLSRRKDGATGETETFTDGRAAFYAKGKTRNGYRITASVDTGEGPIDEIFDRLNDKDPRRVLDRLRTDDNDLYPTYGDDSILYDDTPTQGRIYLRVENDNLRFTWGNYTAGINQGGLLNNTRDLYGAEVRYNTPSVTTNGDSRLSLQAYVASPETAVQRDILRGTGGSVYFLTRRDITAGSVSLTVQVVDPDTGRIVSTKALVDGVDYRVDHIQGVLILSDPLGSSAGDDTIVSEGIGRFDQNLVAQYEFTPTAGTGDADAYGGRAEAWLTDRLRFGVTFMNESTATDDQRMMSADVHYRIGEESYAELEYAETDGPGISRSISTDGGLTISDSGGVTADNAGALRFDSHFALSDLGLSMPGYLDVYFEKKDAGFSTLTEDISSDQTLFGLKGNVEVSEQLSFGGYYETFERDSGDKKDSGELNVTYKVNDAWTVGVAVAHLDQVVVGDADRTGDRTDAAVRLTYSGFEDLTVYGYGQGTLSRSGGLSRNNRVGLGFDAKLTEKLSASGEISEGDLGTAGAFRLSYAASADSDYYLGYSLDPAANEFSNTVSENGTIVVGGRQRITETVTTFAENKYDLPSDRQSITEAYGVKYTPTDKWSFGSTIELGEVRDRVNGDFDRKAFSLGGSYADGDAVTGRMRIEYREDDGDGTAQDRETYGLSASYTNKVNRDWRLLADVDALYSDSAEGDFRDGEYLKFSLGYAYRPIDNERLNLLFRYTYLNDLPGEDQVNGSGSIDGPQQRSHVVSVNGNYDLTQALTVGLKLGYRTSEIAERGTDTFTDSSATLAALRFDWHIVHKWDLFGETRFQRTDEADIDEASVLLGLYRHIGNNAKVGIGYEWGSVSDDLTNLDYDNEGLFINLIAKF